MRNGCLHRTPEGTFFGATREEQAADDRDLTRQQGVPGMSASCWFRDAAGIKWVLKADGPTSP